MKARQRRSWARWKGRFSLYQIFREIWVEDVRRYGHRDTRLVSEPFNRLTSATHRIHSAGVPKVQIPSRASTCPVASFLESWPRARGHVRIFEAGGRFLLLQLDLPTENVFFFFFLLFDHKTGIKIQQRATNTSYSSEIDRIWSGFEHWPILSTTGCTFQPVILYW